MSQAGCALQADPERARRSTLIIAYFRQLVGSGRKPGVLLSAQIVELALGRARARPSIHLRVW